MVLIADNVTFTPPCSGDNLIIPSVPGLISGHVITLFSIHACSVSVVHVY